MIELPPSLEIAREESKEGALYESAKRWLERSERTEGIHASDLLNPRRGYWSRKSPQPLSEREVGTFLIGRVLHSFILHEGSTLPNLGTTDEGSRFEPELGLWYSPDKLAGGKVIEVKTSRAFKEPAGYDDLDSYVQQVLIYLACEQVTEGEIWVLYVNRRDEERRTSPAFRVFTIKISADHLPGLRARVAQSVRDLCEAIKVESCTTLPLCADWLCSPLMCPWWGQCQPEGRYGNDEYLAAKQRRGKGKDLIGLLKSEEAEAQPGTGEESTSRADLRSSGSGNRRSRGAKS